nr:H-NS histone family protein [Delftia sp. PS-11]KAJ8743756.1 H-NS histone family protein [Delftia sp. PS-11]
MSTYKDLLAQKSALEAQIAKAQAERKAEGIAMANEVIKEYGLTADDVFPPAKAGAKPSTVGVAKYRDPATGATWTGRGKPPNWIKDVADRTPFEIKTA